MGRPVSSLSQYDGWTAEGIQRVHGCDALTAMHVVQARAEFVEMHLRHAEEIAVLRSQMDLAHRTGLAVMRAKRAGRKTVRIDEVAA